MVFMLGLIPFFGWLSDLWGPLPLDVGQLPWSAFVFLASFLFDAARFLASGPSGRIRFCPRSQPDHGLRPLGALRDAGSPPPLHGAQPGVQPCMGLVGVTTPLLAESLRVGTHNDMAPAYYLIFGPSSRWVPLSSTLSPKGALRPIPRSITFKPRKGLRQTHGGTHPVGKTRTWLVKQIVWVFVMFPRGNESPKTLGTITGP